MTKILTCILLLLSFYLATFAQEKDDCNCATTLKEVITDVETNYPGYQLKVKGENLARYTTVKQTALTKALLITDRVKCFYVVESYLDFFKDNHLIFTDWKSQPQQIPNLSLLNRKESVPNQDQLIGTWRRVSDSLTVKIIASTVNKTPIYRAYIVQTKDTTFQNGNIYFDLYGNTNEFRIRKYTGALTTDLLRGRRLKNLLIEPNGIWQKVLAKQQNKPLVLAEYAYNNKFKHKAISSDIYYIGIPEFNMLAAKFDSLIVHQILPELKTNKTKHLIIDLRNNQGGNSSFSFLTRFTYNGALTLPGDYVYASPQMIKRYEQSAQEGSALHQTLLPKLIAHPGGFVQRDSLRLKLKESYAYPETVSIITNENCASSTEYLLMLVKPSSKVKVYGRHTAGTLDYSELYGPEKLTCKGYGYLRPTTKSFWVDKSPIDKKGIQPDIDLSLYPDYEWVDTIVKSLKTK